MSDSRPDFLIEMPANRQSEREYAISVLIGDWLGASYAIRTARDLQETRIRPSSESGGYIIAMPDVLLAPSTPWLSLASLPPADLPSIELPRWTGLEGTMPVLYPTSADPGELVARDGPRFVLGLDVVGSLVFLLTRYEEHVNAGQRDAHDRFPASASVLGTSGWLEWPVLDMYLHVFVAALKLAWPRLRVEPVEGPGIAISHDVDHPLTRARWSGTRRLAVVAGDVLRRRDPRLAVRRATAFIDARDGISRHDPYNTFEFLMAASEAAGQRSTFFLLSDDTSLPDGSQFRLTERWAVDLIGEIARRGHRIGLHGSYHSSTDPARLAAEWALLEAACHEVNPGVLRRAVRQHYLRWQPSATWRAQEEAGFVTDASLGYADAIGYRAGTARSFGAYDLAEGRPLGLRVQPLHVMDVTMQGYMSVSWEEAFSRVAEMGSRTRRFGGELSVLWHNSSLETGSAQRFYLSLLAELAR